jgi:hypothetical protein
MRIQFTEIQHLEGLKKITPAMNLPTRMERLDQEVSNL